MSYIEPPREMFTVPVTPVPGVTVLMPISYDQRPRKRAAYLQGFMAAWEGDSVNRAPKGPDWSRQAWLTGHAHWHDWLQEHRVRACDRP